METAARPPQVPHAPTPLRRRHFTATVVGGWGDAQNSYVHAMEWFKGRLYVGVTRNALNGVRPYTRLEGMEIYPVRVPDIQWDLDWRAPIWRYDPEDGGWERAFVSPMAMGSRGFPVPRQWGYRNMKVFQGKSDPEPALYAISWGSHMGPGPHVLRSLDGTHFAEVGDEDLKRQGATSLRGLVPFKGRLFTSPAARCGGTDTGTHDVPIILASDDPGNGCWRQACLPCFGDANNIAVSTMAVMGEYLYAGTMNPTDGYQIWRTTGEGEPPYRWEKVIDGGAGRGNLNEAAATLCPYRGALYVGSGIYNLGFDRIHGVGPGMPELIRIYPDCSWELVAGEPRLTPSGLKSPVSGMGAGFNNPFVGYIWSMCVHDGCLYLGTANWSPWLLFTKSAIWEEVFTRNIPSVDLENLLQYLGGFELWRTGDGNRWEPVTRNGFGNCFNVGVRTMVSTPAGLFVGVVNQFGEEIAVRRQAGWRFEYNQRGGVEVWRGSTARQAATGARQETAATDLPAAPYEILLRRPAADWWLRLVARFYGGSGWHHAGCWSLSMREAWQACENLMEELLAYFRPEAEVKEPKYPRPEKVRQWIAARGEEPWEQYQAARRAKSGEFILDVGCGLGNSTGHLARYYEAGGIVGVAASHELAAACSRRFPELRFVPAKFPRLPLADDAFDRAICVEALGAGGSRRKMLAEIARVLRPGGTLVFADMPSTRKGEPGDLDGYRDLLAELGFADLRLDVVTARTVAMLRTRGMGFFTMETLLCEARKRNAHDFLNLLPGGAGETPCYLFGFGVKRTRRRTILKRLGFFETPPGLVRS